MDKLDGTLTRRQTRAIEAVLTTPNLATAAGKAGLATRTIYTYMRNPAFVAELRRRQDELHNLTVARLAKWLPDAALDKIGDRLEILAQHAAATLSDFIDVLDSGGYVVNLKKAEQAGVLHLIKKLWTTKDGVVQIELYDAQSAATSLMRLALDILSEQCKAAELDMAAQT